MKHIVARTVFHSGICLELKQHFQCWYTSSAGSSQKGRAPMLVADVFLGPSAEQQLQDVNMALGGSQMQGRGTRRRACIAISLSAQE
eukprot:CAMPEP_0172860628 /NCGR_PEP_ID=MMETSP1075-20121228/72195_1 /TAXON_ID=2916 /ORGANISM="Ceratium fusus, Strain PA161109" /LENGTH=86 /DNA_ID=CAMNT_0013708677 /DNA_START=242 /DNA_END=502 /DNA_ORIENTATION=+